MANSAFTLLGSGGMDPVTGKTTVKQQPGLVSSINMTPAPAATLQTPKTTTPQVATSSVTQTKTPTISNIDNVNKTYMSDGQLYALNPTTQRYELSQGPTPTSSGLISSSPLNNPSPTVSQTSTPQTSNYTVNPGLQGDIITGLANMSTQPSEAYTQAQAQAQDYNRRLAESKIKQAEATQNLLNAPSDIQFQTGAVNNLTNKYLQEQAALGAGFQGASNLVGAANIQQGLLQGALQQAGTLNAPQFPSYSSQVYSPSSGFVQGGNMQDAVSTISQKVQRGEMSYDQAIQALSGYGQGGVNALQQSLPSNFNIAQSTALAGQQGTVGVNYQLADTALQNVKSIMNNLGAFQSTNVPVINKAANWVSTQFGINSDQTRAMAGAVQSLRNAYASLLASTKGGTPTDYSSQAAAEIPNEPTPNDIAAIEHNFQVLGQARRDILGNPGAANTQTSTPVRLGNTQFYQDANGNWTYK